MIQCLIMLFYKLQVVKLCCVIGIELTEIFSVFIFVSYTMFKNEWKVGKKIYLLVYTDHSSMNWIYNVKKKTQTLPENILLGQGVYSTPPSYQTYWSHMKIYQNTVVSLRKFCRVFRRRPFVPTWMFQRQMETTTRET